MSGFDPAWLDLREAVDHRSLAAGPLERLAAKFGDAPVSVVDLGAGSGSALRKLAPLLATVQSWTLIDSSAALLDHARSRLRDWADASDAEGDALKLRKDAATIEVRFSRADLAPAPLPPAAAAADLIVAVAFFDLAGDAWLTAFAERLTAARRTLYAPLIYDGAKRFQPPHDLDEAALAAFNAHQRSDKGLGPALGPEAGARLCELARRSGYGALEGRSPWRLGPADRALTTALVRGMASAASETAEAPDGLAAWLAFREASVAGGGEVGHVDLLLEPPGTAR